MASTRRPRSPPEAHHTSSDQYGQLNEAPIELSVNGTNGDHIREFSLPPADGGRQAWLFVVACFFVEAFVWGFPYSYGIFQDYYSTHEPFKGKSGISAIGSTAIVSIWSLILSSRVYTDSQRVSCSSAPRCSS